MRKLIEIKQDYLLECDNKQCDFKLPNPTKDPNALTEQYINVPCPKCGENLLTQRDYRIWESAMAKINWVNRYFSWLRFFSFSRKEEIVEVKLKDANVKVKQIK